MPSHSGELHSEGGFRAGTNYVPAERGAPLKANASTSEEGPQGHLIPSPSAPRQEDAGQAEAGRRRGRR